MGSRTLPGLAMTRVIFIFLILGIALCLISQSEARKNSNKPSKASKPSNSKKPSKPNSSKKPGKKPNKPSKKPGKPNKPNKPNKPTKPSKPTSPPEVLVRSEVEKCATTIDDLTSTISELEANVTEVTKASMRSTGTDVSNTIALADATFNAGTLKCGPQVMTGMSPTLDIFYAKGQGTDQTAATFQTAAGTYTTPEPGWYNICGFLRFRKGGNA